MNSLPTMIKVLNDSVVSALQELVINLINNNVLYKDKFMQEHQVGESEIMMMIKVLISHQMMMSKQLERYSFDKGFIVFQDDSTLCELFKDMSKALLINFTITTEDASKTLCCAGNSANIDEYRLAFLAGGYVVWESTAQHMQKIVDQMFQRGYCKIRSAEKYYAHITILYPLYFYEKFCWPVFCEESSGSRAKQ